MERQIKGWEKKADEASSPRIVVKDIEEAAKLYNEMLGLIPDDIGVSLKIQRTDYACYCSSQDDIPIEYGYSQ
jgi:hypothetical protein